MFSHDKASEILHEIHEGGSQLSQHSTITNNNSTTTYQKLLPLFKIMCEECDSNDDYIKHCKAALLKAKGDIITMKGKTISKSSYLQSTSEYISSNIKRKGKISSKRLRNKF